MVVNSVSDSKLIDRKAVNSCWNKNPDLRSDFLDSDTELIEYERVLHREFAQHNPNNWLCRNYLNIDSDRYRSKIPYSSQRIYGIYEGSQLISAMAVNFDTSHKMQLEAVGFCLNKEAIDCKYGEALNFFICQHKHYHSFEIIRKLRKAVVADLETKDIFFLLSTCSYNVLHLYTRFG